jgi:hypothetical protein
VEHPQAPRRRDGGETVSDGALPHLEGCLTAVGWVLEHVVEHEGAAGREVA